MYDLQFPDYLAGYESETAAKGYLVGVRVVAPAATYELTVYDVARLGEEVSGEVESDGSFAVANLLVVPRVTRVDIARAVERLFRSDFAGLMPRAET
ncbi:hypothetical protein ABZ851_32500 [Streptomyces sp. NPDC047049]|uniref:hypothetical protein n=1 Tax=Streptomyces sp. NPDC047049 TaxID=3156688 RepID=UPI0033DE5E46